MDIEGPEDCDLLVIGGGLTGTAVARDAAGRGLRVCLVEKGDLGAHEIPGPDHAALPHLLRGGWRAVREAARERARLLAIAPHLAQPLRLVLPHDRSLGPRWRWRARLLLRERLGASEPLPPSRSLDLRAAPHGGILAEPLRRGVELPACRIDAARLAVLNALDARERGAVIRRCCEVTSLKRRAQHWEALVRTPGGEHRIDARQVVNAAEPWAGEVLAMAFPGRERMELRLAKSIALVLPRLWQGEHGYLFPDCEGRMVFAVPHERDFTLIGTHDLPFAGGSGDVSVEAGEAAELCAAASACLQVPIAPAAAVARFAGLRVLEADAAGGVGGHRFELDQGGDGTAPAMLTIFGGGQTNARGRAEEALSLLGAPGKRWTATKPLPGGAIDWLRFEAFVADQQRRWPWLGPQMNRRLARAYGTRMARILAGAQGHHDLGTHMGGGLYSAELAYLASHEFARTSEDVLRRRSQLGLRLTEEEQARVAEWFARLDLAD